MITIMKNRCWYFSVLHELKINSQTREGIEVRRIKTLVDQSDNLASLNLYLKSLSLENLSLKVVVDVVA